VALPDRKNRRKSPLRAAEALWWFRDSRGQEQGPMAFRDLRAKALDRKIRAGQQVWREDAGERYLAEAIVGLLPNASPEGEKEATPSDAAEDETRHAASTTERTIADGPPGGLYLPYLRQVHFSILPATLLVGGGLLYATSVLEDPQIRVIAGAFGVTSLLLWLVFSFIVLRRAWDMMSILGARITGIRAVSIMLLPLVNGFWSFTAIFGWARLWNLQVKRNPGLSMASAVWRPVFFAFCVGLLLSQVAALILWLGGEMPKDLSKPTHQFALGTFAVTLLLSLAAWFQLCRSVNFLARKKS